MATHDHRVLYARGDRVNVTTNGISWARILRQLLSNGAPAPGASFRTRARELKQ